MIHRLKGGWRRGDVTPVDRWDKCSGRYKDLPGPDRSASSRQPVVITRSCPRRHSGNSHIFGGVERLARRPWNSFRLGNVITCARSWLAVSGWMDTENTVSEVCVWLTVCVVSNIRLWRGWSKTKNGYPQICFWRAEGSSLPKRTVVMQDNEKQLYLLLTWLALFVNSEWRSWSKMKTVRL